MQDIDRADFLSALINRDQQAWRTFCTHPKLGPMLYFHIQSFLKKQQLMYISAKGADQYQELFCEFVSKLFANNCHVLRKFNGQASSAIRKSIGKKTCGLHTYLYRVLLNWLRDLVRLHKLVIEWQEKSIHSPIHTGGKYSLLIEESLQDTRGIDPDDISGRTEFQQRFTDCLSKLNAYGRIACELFIHGGVSYASVAEVLHIPEKKIYPIFNKARENLARCLRHYYTDADIVSYLKE